MQTSDKRTKELLEELALNAEESAFDQHEVNVQDYETSEDGGI